MGRLADDAGAQTAAGTRPRRATSGALAPRPDVRRSRSTHGSRRGKTYAGDTRIRAPGRILVYTNHRLAVVVGAQGSMPSPDARRKAGPLAPGGIHPVNPRGCRQQDVRPKPGPSTRAASSTGRTRQGFDLRSAARPNPARRSSGTASDLRSARARPPDQPTSTPRRWGGPVADETDAGTPPGRRPDALSVQATVDTPDNQRVAGRPGPWVAPPVHPRVVPWVRPSGVPTVCRSPAAQTAVRTPDKGRRVVRQADRQGRPHLKRRAVGSIYGPRIGAWLRIQTHSLATRRAANGPSLAFQTHGLATRRATNRPSLAFQTHGLATRRATNRPSLALQTHGSPTRRPTRSRWLARLTRFRRTKRASLDPATSSQKGRDGSRKSQRQPRSMTADDV
jgi:hypothetical protein